MDFLKIFDEVPQKRGRKLKHLRLDDICWHGNVFTEGETVVKHKYNHLRGGGEAVISTWAPAIDNDLNERIERDISPVANEIVTLPSLPMGL